MSGSAALLANTILNLSDALTALPLWVAFVLARRAPTRRFGHRVRAEAGIVVAADLGLVDARAIATEAHHQLLHQVPRMVAATIHVNPADTDGRDYHAALAHHR